MQRGRSVPPVKDLYFYAHLFGRLLRILDKNIKVAPLIENPRIDKFKFRIVGCPALVFLSEFLIGEFFLGVFIEILHVGVGRGPVEVVITFLDILTMIPLPGVHPNSLSLKIGSRPFQKTGAKASIW